MDIYYEHNNELKKATLNVSEENPSDFVFLGPIPQNNTLGSAILVGRYDTSLRKVRYQLEGISSSGEMGSLNGQDIIGFCLDNKPNIDPNSLGIYPNWQTIKVVPNPEERGPLELPDAYEYLGDVAITSCSYIEGKELIKEEAEVQDFDYAVIKYKWTNQGGIDLDTRTYISTPNRSSVGVIGWGRLANDADYLYWNDDNTGSGVEGILVNIVNLKRDFPAQEEFIISLGAFWYNTKSSGDLSIEVNTYKGGVMSKSGYDWQNTGGTLVQNLNFNTNSSLQTQTSSTLGTPLGYLSYNTETNLGKLSNIPVENGEVIEPPEEVYPIPDTDTFEFKLLNPEIRLFFPGYIEDWYLEDEDGIFIHPRKSNTDYLSSDTSGGETYIRISSEDNRNKNYKLWISDTSYLRTSVVVERNQPITSSMVVTKFTTNTSNYEFNLKDTNLIVPEILPEHITEIRFSYSEVFNQDISNWDVSNLTNMDYMFRYAQKFNQDLSSWNVERFSVKPYEFDEGALSWTLPKPNWNVPKPDYTPLEFTARTTDVSTHTIEFKDAVGDWFVFKDKTLLGSGTGSANTTDYYQIQDVPEGVNTYQIYVESPSVKLKSHTYSGLESETLTVNSFCERVENQTFELPDCHLIVPTVLPRNLTKLSNMFSGCNLFNQNISSWDTKYVTSMVNMFFGCSSFNQDISDWNTSNVMYMQYMFKQTNFDQDISAWDVSRVINMSHMFESALEFNQPIDIWNVSNVIDMERMFSDARSFNQNLSPWNVTNIPTEPGFFSDTNTWTLPKPVWGTTGVKVVQPLEWTITNIRNSTKELSATLVVKENPEKAVWSLYKNDVLVSDSTGFNTVNKFYYSSYEIYLEMYGSNSGTNTYKFYAEEVISVDLGHASFYDVAVDGDVNVTSFGTGIESYSFGYQNCNLTVPEVLPRHVRSLEGMFEQQKRFNQDISMWDVKLINNMDRTFSGATDYNQDLSEWDVRRIKTKPTQFDEGATSWVAPKPVWGGANFTNVDLTGQSGVYITLSKNSGDWITYNLSDPDFNQNEFLKFVSYNENNTALAFKGYSENNDEVLTAICGFTKDGFARTPISSEDTIGRLYLDDKQTIVPQVLNIESTELTAKPTEGIPRQYDLYYSLTGADATETIVIKSAASVKLEDFVPPPPLGIIPTDYILRYDFNGNITDLSSNNYQSIQSGYMNFVMGRKVGTQALEFEDGKIVTDALSINSTQLTVTCWLKGSQENPGAVFRLGDNDGFHFFYNNAAGSNYDLSDVNVNGLETMTSVARAPYNNTWTFITLILDRLAEEKAIIIKVNNEEKGYSAYQREVNNYADSSLTIGKYDTRFAFVGSIQDVRVYPRILTSEEQTQLFNE